MVLTNKPSVQDLIQWATMVGEFSPRDKPYAEEAIRLLASLEAAPVEVPEDVKPLCDYLYGLLESDVWRGDSQRASAVSDALEAVKVLSRENARLKARPVPKEVERLAVFLEMVAWQHPTSDNHAAAALLRSLATENAALSRRVAELEALRGEGKP